jgi:hypothetical protein
MKVTVRRTTPDARVKENSFLAAATAAPAHKLGF